MRRLAIVASHPIQYHAPLFRALAQETDLEVFYCHRQDAAGQAAAGFGVEFDWDVPLLDGYTFTWLENVARRPDVSTFFGCDTPEVSARLREGAFDACLVLGWYLKSYLQAIVACRQLDVPLLSRGDSQLATSRSAVWSAMKVLPYRWLLGSIDAHLYVGAANRAYLKHYGVVDSALFFAPHFVDNEFFRTRASYACANGQARAVREHLGIPSSAFVFAFAGKLIEKKRPADFVHALAARRAAGNDLWGMIIGSGPLQGELQALATELNAPVRFAGFRNQSELPAYLAAADALVLPSDGRETWGLVVNEAMACGLPAVVSNVAGCAQDLIDEGATGYVFQVGDIPKLTHTLVELARLVGTDQARIRARVAEKIDRYSCKAAVGGILQALESVN